MAFTLYWWHPQRGVHHMTWDSAVQVTTHIESIELRERNWKLYPLEYYSYDLGFSSWWYYCKPPPLNPNDHLTATEVMLSHKNPWQRRSPEGVPKEIRTYHLLLG